jgi:type II secretory ATPase GspE/PulE/Tfp pilus assembly ATPase PilB-like protein
MTRKQKKVTRVCLWCGAEIAPNRNSRSKFCNASHRAMWFRRNQLVKERTDQADKQITRVAECLSYDFSNADATKALKWLKELIDGYLEQGYQIPLPGVADDNV